MIRSIDSVSPYVTHLSAVMENSGEKVFPQGSVVSSVVSLDRESRMHECSVLDLIT